MEIVPIAPRESRSAAAARDAAFLDNVTRHLRHHPQAEVLDGVGRRRPLSGDEAGRIAQVALRAARQWLTAANEPLARQHPDPAA